MNYDGFCAIWFAIGFRMRARRLNANVEDAFDLIAILMLRVSVLEGRSLFGLFL